MRITCGASEPIPVETPIGLFTCEPVKPVIDHRVVKGRRCLPRASEAILILYPALDHPI